MKQTIILALALTAALSAHATGLNLGGTTNQGGHGGAGGDATGIGLGIAGAAAGAAADANASVKSNIESRNTNVLGQHQQQTAISGGNKLTNEGNNAAQKTKVDVVVEGDVTESNTPPVMPGVLPSVPTSCRLYLFGGGSTRDGAGSGTFPIGNDQTCLSIAALNLMERAGGFTQAEKQAVVCKVEGMAALETCKNLGRKQSAAAQQGEGLGQQAVQYQDPIIRRRLGLPPL